MGPCTEQFAHCRVTTETPAGRRRTPGTSPRDRCCRACSSAAQRAVRCGAMQCGACTHTAPFDPDLSLSFLCVQAVLGLQEDARILYSEVYGGAMAAMQKNQHTRHVVPALCRGCSDTRTQHRGGVMGSAAPSPRYSGFRSVLLLFPHNTWHDITENAPPGTEYSMSTTGVIGEVSA